MGRFRHGPDWIDLLRPWMPQGLHCGYRKLHAICIGLVFLGFFLYANGSVSYAQTWPPDGPSPVGLELTGENVGTAPETGQQTPTPPGALGDNQQLPSDNELVESGAIVGEIIIRNENIFDLSDPKENNWLFRLANGIHVKTKPWVIRGQLLFRTGDPYNPRLLLESERNLRSNRNFYEVVIRPVALHDGRVDVEVFTRDTWTLRFGFRFGRAGGANNLQFNIGDINALGTGVALQVSLASTPDRNIFSVAVDANPVPTTRVNTKLLYAKYSDGWARGLSIERPFYSLDTRWAAGASYSDNLSVTTMYGVVDVANEFQTHAKTLVAWGGYSDGLRGRWVKRLTLGFARDESLFSPAPDAVPTGPLPPDRILAYPWVGIELLEDSYEKARNRDQIARTEDFYLGTKLNVRLGYSDPVFGANQEGAVFRGSFGTSFRPLVATSLFIDGNAAGRYDAGSLQDTFLGVNGRFYMRRRSENWLAFSSFNAKWGINLDPDHELLLGGDTGLRGYPRNYQAGVRSGLFTLEGRYYSDWYPFRLVRLGAAVFYDMGRCWGGDFVNKDSGVLRDVGVGLRVGLARSAQGGIVHVDLAFPLDGDQSIARVQLLVGSEYGF